MRSATTIALGALMLVLGACGADDMDLAVDSTDTAEDEAADETSSQEAADDGPDDGGAADETDPADDVDAAGDADHADADEADDAGDAEQGAAGSDQAADAPTPDAALVADPCAAHEGREMDAFIDLVAPVDEQVATGSVEIVGCSNVFEATIVWHLLDGDGVLLDEGFTTAECGNGCVGAFADDVPLDAAAGEPVAYLQVFSPNASDEGPSQLELVERIVVLG